jgi:outer membrane biosynthesis protein TonB
LDQVEVNAKVKELEDEVKVLKAEIRNVLLDIREAILDNTNPLSEQEPAYLRMDLNTTARAMAAEEAARAARDAMDQTRGEEPKEDKPEEPEPAASAEPPPEEEEAPEETASEEPTEEELEEPEPASADLPPEEEETPEEATSEEPTEDEPSGDGDLSSNGKASRKALPDAPIGAAGLPPMQLAYLLPTGAIGGLAAWVTEAMDAIGPQDLERVITIHRLWGSLPPNISYALAHLQRLIRSSKQKDPPWLKIMQDMEKLASS